MGIERLIHIDQVTKRMIYEKESPDTFTIIPSTKLEEYIEQGWELVPRKYKTKNLVKKPKSHNDAFEEKIWALLAKMKFKSLNKDKSVQSRI